MAEDGKKQDPRTVFVRGIDASVTDEALQEFFSEIGPVKKAFLVKRGKDGPHRGFGFVQFAIQDDAARAAADLHGKELAGRKLKVRCVAVVHSSLLHCGCNLVSLEYPPLFFAAPRRWREP